MSYKFSPLPLHQPDWEDGEGEPRQIGWAGSYVEPSFDDMFDHLPLTGETITRKTSDAYRRSEA